MGRNILKNTGRILPAIIILFSFRLLFAAEIETELTPSRITVGESASLRIKITGKSSSVKPVKFPAINGLEITFTGSSRSFQYINGKSWSGTVLNFSIYAEKKGDYKIPPFILEADGQNISSREVSLTVGESGARSTMGGGQLRGDIDLSSETVYTGEPVIMRYFLRDNGGDNPEIEGFSEQPHVKGFVMKSLDEKPDEPGKTFAGIFYLVPVDKGVHEIGGGSVEVAVEMSQGFFSMSGRKRISFPYKKINVIPIPPNGRPEKFSGNVGEFRIEAEIPSGKFRLFEEIKIPVKISGRGNLLTLSKPQIENEDGIKVVVEEKEQNRSAAGNGLAGEKNFLVTIIPQRDGTINPGRIFADFFNPYKKVYEKAESAPLSFEIQKGEIASEKGEVQFNSDSSSGIKFNYYIAAVIFFIMAFLIAALVMWERKKFRMIREELTPDLPDESDTGRVDRTDDVIKNLQTSMNGGSSDLFLQSAEIGLSLIDALKLKADESERYNLFREKIYSCRYGGAELTETEMKELNEWLRKYLKQHHYLVS